MKDLRGKTAVITGAASGIGLALARRAAREGMRLVLADLDAGELDAAATELGAAGAEILARQVDVAQSGEVWALADEAFARFGAVHLLANNAGVALCKPAWEVSAEDWAWVLGVNLHGVIHGLQAFVPRMLAGDEEGRIVNTASAAGLLSPPGFAAYSVSKHAVVALSEVLHHDLALRESRLKVSVLCPAWVRTRIAQSDRHRQAPEGVAASAPDGVSEGIAEAVRRATEAGLEPEAVADAVFEADAADRFYILTHAATKAGVRRRMEDILEDRPPTLLDLKA
ncbi:MAG: SDR family NAD(P)-dependent oxidoreductase [Holophagaceae bacterium]|nr:SDR family NAD(P)-dependent oxidoreductase [Holophagaceae bacterium]